MGKIKEGIKSYKELVKDPKRNALIKLGIYFIFMTILVLFIRFNYKEDNYIPVIDVKTQLSTLTNYQYTYKIDYIDNNIINTLNINGSRYNNEEMLAIDNINYYIKDDILYLITLNKLSKVEIFPILLANLEPAKIYNMIKSLTPTVRNAEEGKSIYYVPVTDFVKVYSNQKEENTVLSIPIVTYETNNNISKIELDLSTFINSSELLGQNLKIELNYTNINGVNKFNNNFETSNE